MFRLLDGDINSHGAVVTPQISVGDPFHVVGSYLFNPIAIQEVQPPISLSRPVRKIDGQSGAVGRIQLELLEELLPGALGFFGRHAIRAHLFDRIQNHLQHDIGFDSLVDLGGEAQHAWIVEGVSAPGDARSLARFDERFVKPP